jgi:carboxypeptidase PM20D1
MDLSIRSAALTAAAALTTFVAICVTRALLHGQRAPAAPLPPSIASLAPSLLSDFLANKKALASRLAAALRLRTISFETPEGHPVSLLPASSGAPAPTLPPCSGCGCCSAALGGDAAPARDARSAPTPAALEDSRAAFLAFHAHLAACFPRLHGALERRVVNTYSLVFVWRPREGALPAPGVALCAHMDVVPAPDAAEWTHPPFAGVVDGTHVHGRGAIDDKHSLMAICEAVEALLARGFSPARPVVLAFGHDEEIGGFDGARAIAAALPAALAGAVPPPPEKPLSFLLDEGLFLLSDFMPGLRERVAVVCTSEKGHVNVELAVEGAAGHSSIPPRSGAIGALARAVAAVEAAPQPVHLAPAAELFDALLPAMPFLPRLLFSNRWALSPLVVAALLARPATAAMLRTTTAVTLVGGGVKSNVLPPRAAAVVNRRVHPRDTVAAAVARDAAVAARAVAAGGGGGALSVRALEPLEPSPVSSTCSEGWRAIGHAVAASFEGRPLQAPGLMLGNTDTRHYWDSAVDIYRHCPTELTIEETKYFHGRNERIKITNLARLATFYACVIAGACSPQAGK